MSFSNDQERILALAAIYQAAKSVAQTAENASCDLQSYHALIESLFIFTPESTLDVYGNEIENLRPGLTALADLSNLLKNKEESEAIRYMLSLIALQKQVAKQSGMLDVIRSRLEHSQFKKEHFSDATDDMAGTLSGIYQDTISTLPFRIHVTGNMQHLTQTAISDRIRTLLFAGVRAVMLWKQLGGNKWQLLFGRSKIEKLAKELLNNHTPTRH